MENIHERGMPFSLEEWDMGTSESPTVENASQVQMVIQDKFWYWCISYEL